MSVARGVSLSSYLTIVARQTWLYQVTATIPPGVLGECQCVTRAVSLLVAVACQHVAREVPF